MKIYYECRELARGFPTFRMQHVFRERNRAADFLVRTAKDHSVGAMDAATLMRHPTATPTQPTTPATAPHRASLGRISRLLSPMYLI